MLREIVERPMAIGRLVAGEPFQPGGDGRFRNRVSAALAQHLFSRGAASSGESSWDHLGATVSTRCTKRACFSNVGGVHPTALTAVKSWRGRQGLRRSLGSVHDSYGLVRIHGAGDA